MGTSTCDVMVGSYEAGRKDSSRYLRPGGQFSYWNDRLEAGQSSFGDVYAWFRNVLSWPIEAIGPEIGLTPEQQASIRAKILERLTEAAQVQ